MNLIKIERKRSFGDFSPSLDYNWEISSHYVDLSASTTTSILTKL